MPPPPRLPVQKVGEYDVVGHIGTGGMGAVYEGRHPVIGKRVAIKVLLPQYSEDKDALRRFFDEAKAVNAIRHRGIVDIFGMGQLPDGSHYLMMEYLEGQSFDQLLKARKSLPVLEALTLLEEVLEAVGAAHAAKIIHRDLKPSNLFLVENERGRPYVKLLDFGVAKLSSDADGVSKVEASGIVGTPIYMSPEQITGKRAGPPADIYALGVMLFELVAGKPPFFGASLIQMMSMHREAKPPRLTELKPGTPIEVERLVDRMLAKAPQDRPQDAEALRAEVASIRARLESRAAPTIDEDIGPTRLRPASSEAPAPLIDNGPTAIDRPLATPAPTAHQKFNDVTELPTDPFVPGRFPKASGQKMISHSSPTLVSAEVKKDPRKDYSAAAEPESPEATSRTRIHEAPVDSRMNPLLVYALVGVLGFAAMLGLILFLR
jgi:serine/threonine-protein kinase